MGFHQSTMCRSGRFCVPCRNDPNFRATIEQTFQLPHDFPCPEGAGFNAPLEQLPERAQEHAERENLSKDLYEKLPNVLAHIRHECAGQNRVLRWLEVIETLCFPQGPLTVCKHMQEDGTTIQCTCQHRPAVQGTLYKKNCIPQACTFYEDAAAKEPLSLEALQELADDVAELGPVVVPEIPKIEECEIQSESKDKSKTESKTEKVIVFPHITHGPLDSICVIGHPSKLGGADTELDHQITIWQDLGLKVHILPTGPLDAHLRSMNLEGRGCHYLSPKEWSGCAGMPVISYCNSEFLKAIEQIHQHAACTIWVNCMTWCFDDEKQAHQKGLIDWFVYQTEHQRKRVVERLRLLGPIETDVLVHPWFDADRFPFVSEKAEDAFRFCRISRADTSKYSAATNWIYDRFVSPVPKQGAVLGVNDKVREKLGQMPSYVALLNERSVPVYDLLSKSHILLQPSGLYENLPRVGMEAMASGTVLIVDNFGGWKELVDPRKTGWLCNTDQEFVYAATRMAFEPKERSEMALAAREKLLNTWSKEASTESWRSFFAKVEHSLK